MEKENEVIFNPNQLNLFTQQIEDSTQGKVDEIKDDLQESLVELKEAIEKFENTMSAEGSPWRKYLDALCDENYDSSKLYAKLGFLSNINRCIDYTKHSIKQLEKKD
jgi:hypothetical protein